MKETTDVRQGTLALMVLKTLDVLGPLHGYGIAQRIEQISGAPPKTTARRASIG
jgi:DNA-binding PadR family transcriptional regulator